MSSNETFEKEMKQENTGKDITRAVATAVGIAAVAGFGISVLRHAIRSTYTGQPSVAGTAAHGFRLGGKIGLGLTLVPALAQLIDKKCAKADDTAEEVIAEDFAEEEEIVEEPAEEIVEEVAEPAPVVEETVPTMAESEADGDEDDDDEDEDGFGFSGAGLRYIDVKAEPEEYAKMLEEEKAGETQIAYRYRRSFLSRIIQGRENVQPYYSEIKNKLLSYKGVKARTSWGNESFNKGRTYIAKLNAKSKSIYLYLAIDPSTLEDSKYNFDDVSSKKKYENVPVLIKIKGERKLKYALELIDLICRDNLELPPVKNFTEEDYSMPYRTTEEMVETGEVKKLAARIPAVTEE